MQSLPTALTTAQVNGLVSQLEALPSAKVNRHPDIITVTATRKTTGETVKVLSAATRDGKQWHVMTVPGIITVKANA
jgi:hypothetical protein